MNTKESINIYWYPAYFIDNNNKSEWNMLYPDPDNLFTLLSKNKNPKTESNSYFSCPATKDFFKKTYVFNNAVSCKYEYNFDKNSSFFNPITKNYIDANIIRPGSINLHPIISFSLFYIFFSDEPVIATFSMPTFHKPEYINYGACIPGEFDIGQWFRPYVMEFQLWNNVGTFELKEDEPLFYVKFNTDKKINLHRFKYNEQLSEYSKHCINYKNIFGSFSPLSDRYKKFKNSKLNNLILKEIKNNIVSEGIL